MTIDPTLPDGKPSASKIEMTTRAILVAHPELDGKEATSRACSLVSRGALTIDVSTGDVGVKSTGVDLVRQIAPGLLGERPTLPQYDGPAKTEAEKVRRADERAANELARRAQPRPAPKRISQADIAAKMAEAVAADPSLARSPERRATVRDRLTREAFAAAGIGLGGLDADGVNS